jgi:beta-N-acetylhexosaminidase
MTTDLLRQQVGFKGLVITDDLQMGAINAHYDLATRVRLALQAGADMLLFSNQLVKTPQNTQELLNIMQQQVQNGAISPQQIAQSYQRVVRLKQGLR